MQKTAGKNTKYSRNGMSLKIGHLAKAIASAKWSVGVKNLSGEKQVVLYKKSLEKIPNIREMR